MSSAANYSQWEAFGRARLEFPEGAGSWRQRQVSNRLSLGAIVGAPIDFISPF